MSVKTAIARGRAAAEALHRDTFKVYRPTGVKVEDPVTKVETDVFDVIHPSVMGKLQAGQTQPRETQTPGVKLAETSLFWHTSVNTLGVLTDDEVECIAVDPDIGDPDQVGSRVRITGPVPKSIATARRFPVSEIT